MRAPRIFALAWSFVAVSACLPACGPAPLIHASDYDQKCKEDSDCVGVVDGTLTCCGTCFTAAISERALPQYQADQRDRTPSCDGVPCPAIACAQREPVCTAGKCALAAATP